MWRRQNTASHIIYTMKAFGHYIRRTWTTSTAPETAFASTLSFNGRTIPLNAQASSFVTRVGVIEGIWSSKICGQRRSGHRRFIHRSTDHQTRKQPQAIFEDTVLWAAKNQQTFPYSVTPTTRLCCRAFTVGLLQLLLSHSC